MTNEWAEFKAYTGQVKYAATGKRDTSYLGRMTFDTITDHAGLGRILTVLARGYLYHGADGSVLSGNPYERMDRARSALCAWCSVPDQKRESIPPVDYRELSGTFPELVNANGEGWYWRHVRNVIKFVKKHPETTSANAQKKCGEISMRFTREWKSKVRQLQIPIFDRRTKGAWILRFDDILADALEAGSLRMEEYDLPESFVEQLKKTDLNGVPFEVASDVICYCLANQWEDTEWIVLPVASFDCWYGNTNFSRKWLNRLPNTIIERAPQRYGICRIRLSREVQTQLKA